MSDLIIYNGRKETVNHQFLSLLKKNHIYNDTKEHDSCGVGLVASTEGLKSRKVVEQGIQALKAVWHRGAIDADGKTGDGAGIHLSIPEDFFIEQIERTGQKPNKKPVFKTGFLLN